MSDCCAVPGSTEVCAIVADKGNSSADSRCSMCGIEGRPVERQTVLHHVKHEHLERVDDEAFRFCGDQQCPVVYYGDRGTRFTVDEVRELVGAKVTGDARPICYCFGFTEGDAREEVVRTGKSTIPATVSGLIKARMCACEVRNPSGACCLGEVTRTVKRLSDEHETSMQVALPTR
jgi:hypothetical protein